jgi:NitT/TauT family transport system substrate-binding protein
MKRRSAFGGLVLAVVLVGGVLPVGAAGVEIEVSGYGIVENGLPYAVAMEKGFFKEYGANITGIRGSTGGGTTVRNLIAGSMPYADTSLAAAVTAILRGMDLKIIAQSSYATAVAWITMPNSPIQSIRDIKGKKVGYTNPQSSTEGFDMLLLETLNLTKNEVTLVKTGGFGEGLALLEHGGIDVMPLGEPLLSKSRGKYRVLAWGREVLPAVASDFAVTTGKAARETPDLIRAIVAGRRKAVEYMATQPDESAQIIAKAYELPPEIIRSVINNLLINVKPPIKPYWIGGKFDYEAMDRAIRAQRLIGVIKEDVDWSKMVDESFLPEDLRSKR